MGVEYIGPFEETIVVIDGRKVPFLGVEKDAEGVVRFLHLQSRCIDLPPFDPDRPYEAEILITFIADAIAVGMGYTGWPDAGGEFVKRPDFPIVHQIGEAHAD